MNFEIIRNKKKIILIVVAILGLIIITVLIVSTIKAYRIRHKEQEKVLNNGPAIGIADNNQNNSTTKDKNENEIGWPSLDAKYITAMPVDLTQIQGISKYRSCAGHDRSGYTFAQVLETNRSMKHYFYPVSAFQGTIDKVKMFAPFDGTVSVLNLEKDKVGGRPQGGNGIDFSTSVDKNVAFGFGHIYFVKDFKVGDKVTAGELIGYAALGDKGYDFDIDLKGAKYNSDGKEILDSAFDHMTDEVLAEFAKNGITPENTKISKETRDASPCDYNNPTSSGRLGDDWTQLNQ